MKNLLFRTTVLLAFAGLFAACWPESANPLPPDGKVDRRLIGRWAPDSGKKGYLDILPGEGNSLKLVFLDPAGKPRDSSKGKITTTRLKGQDYLSVVFKFDGKPLPRALAGRFSIMRYEISKEKGLRLFAMNRRMVQTDIKNGALKGSFERGPEGFITAGSRALARYVAHKNPVKLFDNKVLFLTRK